ncbi:hypothetical protein GWI33_004286 [Rhynchophorus ferrugineus]|uniref:Uncharacterized protein n=1 Tax=Rhynchophorus ferrugineus TaxID=354439 RepID=A0A834IN99_RHYFE|nr:hypothetical protein GWI33_004286 [Rhynchophorus ferrugineus]
MIFDTNFKLAFLLTEKHNIFKYHNHNNMALIIFIDFGLDLRSFILSSDRKLVVHPVYSTPSPTGTISDTSGSEDVKHKFGQILDEHKTIDSTLMAFVS